MSEYNPLVSIIINTHNNKDFLPIAIDSACAQKYENFEIIVYDNASTEDLIKVVEPYGERVRYFRSDAFSTLGHARNEALKVAKGELIDYLDSDDLFEPEKLKLQVPLFEDPKVGLVFSNCTFFKEVDGTVHEKLAFSKPPTQGNIFRNLLEDYYLRFETSIFRKSAIGTDPKNWFPEQFQICTDFDLFLKISHSYEIKYVDKSLAKWRLHENNLSIVKSSLSFLEQLIMIPRILEYEPKLFQKYPKEMKRFSAKIQSNLSKYYWQIKVKREAWLRALHAFLLVPSIQDLLLLLLIPFFSFEYCKSIKERNKDELQTIFPYIS